MNEIAIAVNYDNEKPTVSGRELHKALMIDTPYTMWFTRMCEYGFTEGADFITNLLESTGGRPSTDHALTIDMAKELCMIQRTEIGKRCREYFLAIERHWNSPEAVMARALQFANQRLELIITLWVNSPGGNVFAAAEIYTMIRDYPHNVTVKIASIAASAASVIAMAGDTVQMSPTALLFVHDPSTIAMGNAKDMEKVISTLNEVKESMCRMILMSGWSSSMCSQSIRSSRN